MVCVMPDKTSKSARDAFADVWIKHYSWIELLVTDQGPEFIGREFANYVSENGCLHHFIDSQSPWQNGRTERAGGALKEQIYDALRELGDAVTARELIERVVPEAVTSRNAFINRSGYSAIASLPIRHHRV